MPFIPFIIGVAVGSAVTYVVTDDSGKQLVKDTGGKITSGVGAVTGKVTGMFKKSKDEAAEVATDVAEEVTDTAEESVVASS